MLLEFKYIDEPVPGDKWLSWFDQYWPAYRAWFLSQGESERPTYREVMRALNTHMPEIVEDVELMTQLAGGSDHVARFLGQYCPPPFFAACSQTVITQTEPVLIRNYDYAPRLCDGLIMKSRWRERSIIGMADCMSGLVDGMNESGLAVSLAFGGRQEVGPGFGISLIQRYLLETCDFVHEAVEKLITIPVQIAYNVTLLDSQSQFATVKLSPDQPAVVTSEPYATNHQDGERWEAYTQMIETDERYAHLSVLNEQSHLSSDMVVDAFLQEPLFRDSFEMGYGTCYTAVYYPLRKEAHYIWQDARHVCTFSEGKEWTQLVSYSENDQDSVPYWPAVHRSSARLRNGFVSA